MGGVVALRQQSRQHIRGEFQMISSNHVAINRSIVKGHVGISQDIKNKKN